jgi:hypothetical protein
MLTKFAGIRVSALRLARTSPDNGVLNGVTSILRSHEVRQGSSHSSRKGQHPPRSLTAHFDVYKTVMLLSTATCVQRYPIPMIIPCLIIRPDTVSAVSGILRSKLCRSRRQQGSFCMDASICTVANSLGPMHRSIDWRQYLP